VGGNTTIDPTAAMVARRRGLDLERHQPRAIASAHVESADLLVAMEPAQLSMVHALARTRGAQSTLLGLWSMPRRVCLTDPFGLHEEYFNRCFMLIDSAIARMSAELTEASHVHSGS
jgi:protein-tyrosine-phosphatase